MAAPKATGYVARTSGIIEDEKHSLPFVRGRTRLRAGHWAIKQLQKNGTLEDLFEPIEDAFDDDKVEQATAAPKE